MSSDTLVSRCYKMSQHITLFTDTSRITRAMSLWEDAVFNNSTSGSSVYTGLGGVLYMYLMQYRITNSKEYLDYAKQTARKLKKRIESKREYQEKDCTFLSGRAGSFALLAVVADLSKEDCTPYQQGLIDLQEVALNLEENELLYGRVGYLYAATFINRYFGQHIVSEQNLVEVIDKVLKDGKKLARKKVPFMWEWHNSQYIGAVHGVAGILYILLDYDYVKNNEKLMLEFEELCDWMASLVLPSGNFPSREGGADRLMQFCHGAGGVIHVFIKMFEITGKAKFLQVAMNAAKAIRTYGVLHKGVGLCHGIGGNALAFLKLWKVLRQNTVTDPEQYWEFFLEFVQIMVNAPQALLSKPDDPYSLFNGISGGICVLAQAKMILERRENGETIDFNLIQFPGFDHLY